MTSQMDQFERRMRRYACVWWSAFGANFVSGAYQAATGGAWIWLAWVHAVAAGYLIFSRRRFHRMMLALRPPA